MERFFAAWRRLSDRIASVLVLGCGLMAIVGGIQLLRMNGPTWIAIFFIGAGTGLLLLLRVLR
jgi:TRAP-type C4-dicarboxylate transport system permease small subunit